MYVTVTVFLLLNLYSSVQIYEFHLNSFIIKNIEFCTCQFYQIICYQGVAEKELERDIERTFIMLVRSATDDKVRIFLTSGRLEYQQAF